MARASMVELDWDVRQKSRFDTTDSAGRSLAVFLPRGTVVRGGDVLVAGDVHGVGALDEAKGGEDIHVSLCDMAVEVLERQR